MKYTGRLVNMGIALIAIVILRVYAVIYLDYSLFQPPYVGCIILLLFWWLGKQYDTVKFLSEKDTLTKLYNRRFVIDRFPKLVESANNRGQQINILLIDIDDFKIINDTYGHATGDYVLKQIANTLLQSTGKSAVTARWAGDEFLIVTLIADEISTPRLINTINEELKKPSKDLDLPISVSIGTAEYPRDAKKLDELLNIADQNMYKQKAQKKDVTVNIQHAHIDPHRE